MIIGLLFLASNNKPKFAEGRKWWTESITCLFVYVMVIHISVICHLRFQDVNYLVKQLAIRVS